MSGVDLMDRDWVAECPYNNCNPRPFSVKGADGKWHSFFTSGTVWRGDREPQQYMPVELVGTYDQQDAWHDSQLGLDADDDDTSAVDAFAGTIFNFAQTNDRKRKPSKRQQARRTPSPASRRDIHHVAVGHQGTNRGFPQVHDWNWHARARYLDCIDHAWSIYRWNYGIGAGQTLVGAGIIAGGGAVTVWKLRHGGGMSFLGALANGASTGTGALASGGAGWAVLNDALSRNEALSLRERIAGCKHRFPGVNHSYGGFRFSF